MNAKDIAQLHAAAPQPCNLQDTQPMNLKDITTLFGKGTTVSAIVWRQAADEERKLFLSFSNLGDGTLVELTTDGTFTLDSPSALRRLAKLADDLREAHEAAEIFG